MFFLEDKALGPHWGWGGPGNPHSWCFACVLEPQSVLPARILSDLPTAPRADVTIPTRHRRQPRLGPRLRARGVAGIQMQASLPEKSKLLSDCHAAPVTAKHQTVIRVNLGVWVWILKLLQPNRVYLEGFRKFSSKFCLLLLLLWTIFKVLIEFVTELLLFCVLVFWPRGMWDPSFQTRDRTHVSLHSKGKWTPREVPLGVFWENVSSEDICNQ